MGEVLSSCRKDGATAQSINAIENARMRILEQKQS